MLNRKPRVNERLDYDGRETCTVLRFLDAPHDAIMSIQFDDGRESLIIWQFKDGLNKLLSHTEDA